MTIAISLMTPEGAVLGADSTATVSDGSGKVAQLFNSAQKVFEIGPRIERFDPGSMFSGGVVMFNEASCGPMSWRNVISAFYRQSVLVQPDSFDVPARFLAFVQATWANLQHSGRVPGSATIPDTGFMIACIPQNADEVIAAQVHLRNATIEPLQVGAVQIGGGFEVVSRLLYGYDVSLEQRLIQAGVDRAVFSQSVQDLRAIPPIATLPIRDAIDFVHFLAYSAVKLHRYRGGPATIGGAIEIATITADRGFRWICHKPLHESIGIPRGVTAS